MRWSSAKSLDSETSSKESEKKRGRMGPALHFPKHTRILRLAARRLSANYLPDIAAGLPFFACPCIHIDLALFDEAESAI